MWANWQCRNCDKLCNCDKAESSETVRTILPSSTLAQYSVLLDGNYVLGATPPSILASMPCTTFFNAGVGKVGIRNNCDVCKSAVVAWTTGGGTVIKKYEVKAYNQVIVTSEGQAGQLIGEEPCP